MTFWDRPENQSALADRAMDRDFLPQPADTDRHASSARPDDPTTPKGYCEKCGYLHSTHDPTGDPSLGWAPPWGCPTEALARQAWGGDR